jgi:2,4-dienoyl-CoA reductase-like NADH-dependent reductase (Old Yellow Enzyme family)
MRRATKLESGKKPRRTFKGVLILSGGYDAARAESDLEARRADLIAVGRPLLANPGFGRTLENRRPAQSAG